MRDYKQISQPSTERATRGKAAKAKAPAGNRLKKSAPKLPVAALKRALLYVSATVAAAAAIGAAVAGVSAAYARVSGVNLLPLQKIEVVGNRKVPTAEIVDASSAHVGESLYAFSLPGVAKRVGKNPWIKNVSVRRLLPDTLHVGVLEREAAAIVSLRYLYYVDRDGVIFKPLAQNDDWELPIITGITEEELAADSAQVAARLRKSLALVEELKQEKSINFDQFSEINIDKHNGYTLFTSNGGVPVALGVDDYAAKLERLNRISPSIAPNFKDVAYIDLHHADRVVVGYRHEMYHPPKPALPQAAATEH